MSARSSNNTFIDYSTGHKIKHSIIQYKPNALKCCLNERFTKTIEILFIRILFLFILVVSCQQIGRQKPPREDRGPVRICLELVSFFERLGQYCDEGDEGTILTPLEPQSALSGSLCESQSLYSDVSRMCRCRAWRRRCRN